jgi:hypothetical protein
MGGTTDSWNNSGLKLEPKTAHPPPGSRQTHTPWPAADQNKLLGCPVSPGGWVAQTPRNATFPDGRKGASELLRQLPVWQRPQQPIFLGRPGGAARVEHRNLQFARVCLIESSVWPVRLATSSSDILASNSLCSDVQGFQTGLHGERPSSWRFA